MNVFIVHAHPEPKSFSSSLKNIMVEHFSKSGHNVEVSDLYKMNFNPVGGRIDFNTTSNPEYFSYLKEQMNAFHHKAFADDIKIEMEKLLKADLLIFNFPLWWSSMPAILKGWADRIFALGFSYHPKNQLYTTGIFRGKKAMCVATAGGSEAAYSAGGDNGDIMEVIYHINHGLFYYCGMDVLPPFFTWKTHLVEENILKTYLVGFQNHLNSLETFKPLY